MITESWLSSSVCNEVIAITGYNVYRGDRNSNADMDHGGVAIFVKSICQSKKLNFADIQLEHVGITFEKNGSRFVCVCVYRPPSSKAAEKANFCEQLERLIQMSTIMQNTDAVVFGGDFNEDLLGKCSTPIHDIFIHHGFQQQVKQSTTDKGTLIDHIYLRENTMYQNQSHVIQTLYSYHDACMLQMHKP